MADDNKPVASGSAQRVVRTKSGRIQAALSTIRRPSFDTLPVTPLHQRDTKDFLAIIIGGSLLSFNAGFINSATLLINSVTVSHVTGALTKASIFLENGHYVKFAELLGLILSFIAGSLVSAVLISKQTFHLGRSYNRVFGIATSLLIIAYMLEVYENKGEDSKAYAYFAAIACGMQNAMTTKYSGNILRTTHMTGTATDIGIVLGRILKGRHEDSWKLAVMLPMFISYFIGGLGGAGAYRYMGKHVLLVNVILFGGTGMVYCVYLALFHHMSICKILVMGQDIDVSTHIVSKPQPITCVETTSSYGTDSDRCADSPYRFDVDDSNDLTVEPIVANI